MPRQAAKHQRATAKMTWFECDQPGCTYKTKHKGNLTTHKAMKHNIAVTWYCCDVEDCDYKAKTAGNLKTHKSDRHNMDVNWHYCDVENCEFKTKSARNLKTHKSDRHNMDVNWHYCDVEDCEYKSKHAASLKTHKANRHNMDVNWHYCDQPGCKYKTKQKSHLKPHLEMVHDIGDHECQICLKNRNSRNKHVDNQGSHMICCNNCYYKVTGKKTRKEKIWSDFLDQHLECPAVASDKSLKSIGGCILERPDKLYTDISYTEIGECDEYEHLYHNGNYTCDEQRISKIYDQEGIIGTFMNVLRWNPDKYTVPEEYQRKTQKERLEIYVALAKKLREKANNNEFRDRIHIYYLFYSEDNPLIAKNIPYTMIYSMDDVITKV